ncbi:restriction endonuclease subunit S [Streptomyces sp. URMC 125]|uniref:restriction endonuclease subunit S n=1 Tax=Streptomyces sp. URMC 125 TaxID=3423419 RepID=UPI003F1DD9CA
MAEWPALALGELCDPSRGITYGIVKVGDFVPGGIPVIRGGDIRDNRIVFNDEKRVTRQVSDQYKRTILQGGELVINLIAEPGHSAIVPPEMAGFNVSRDVAVIPLSDAVNHDYVNWYLKSPAAIEWLTARLSGSVTQKINLGVLREIPIPVPERSYQDRLTLMLGALEKKIILNERIKSTIDDLIRSLWVYALSRPGTRSLPLFSALSVTFGASFKSSHFNEEGVGRPLLRIRDLRTFSPKIWTTQQLDKELVVAPGDTVAGMDAEFRPTFWLGEEALLNQRVLHAQSNIGGGSALCREALRLPLALVESYKTGTTVAHLNKGDLSTLILEVPSAKEVAFFERSAVPLHERLVASAAETRALIDLRDTLLPQLMSGKLRVRDAEKIVEDAV